MIVATSMVVVVINIIMCIIFERIVSFEKRQTANDETIAQFQKITIVQYINIGIVILLVNFDSLQEPLLGFIPILNGDYTGFTAKWYE
jgi:predicted exporter